MNDLRKTLVDDLNDVETALCALEGVKPGTVRQNGYTGDFKGVMAYPVLLVQKGREQMKDLVLIILGAIILVGVAIKAVNIAKRWK